MENETDAPIKPPSRIYRVFMGKNGIRAGWSIGIFVIIVGVATAVFIIPLRMYLLHMHWTPDGSTPIPMALMELSLFLGTFIGALIMTRIEHRPLISYGFDGPKRLANFFYGLLFGFVALSVLVGAMILCGFLSFDGVQIFGWRAVKYAAAWGAVFLVVGLYEEYFTRGYLLSTLTRGVGFWWGAIILSVAFGSFHLNNKGESPVGIFSAAAIGLVFCVSLWYQKTLWWAIGFHAAWDWAESYFWGTADSGMVSRGHLIGVHPQGNILWSGGATGPEGSLLIVPLILIIALLMWLAWRKKAVASAKTAPGQTLS